MQDSKQIEVLSQVTNSRAKPVQISHDGSEMSPSSAKWAQPQLWTEGKYRVELLRSLGEQVFAMPELRFCDPEHPDFPEGDPGDGFCNVVMLIPTHRLQEPETYDYAKLVWKSIMDPAPLWITHWKAEFDERLEKGDPLVVNDALDAARLFVPRKHCGPGRRSYPRGPGVL